ncbi:MAG: choice-of-anchor J domain-containing protein, partial [Bacteroidales bacterium]|nr:choice-of-anchor J domain-containing protein [Bacteroidales bacterium]
QQCWFHKINNGQKGKKYTINLDLGAKWITPRMELTYIPGEESIYMGGKKKVMKLTYNPSKDKVQITELPHEFSHVVRTVVAAEANPNRMYLTTKAGRFYYSSDRGNTWTESEFTKTNPFVSSNQGYGGWAGEVIEVPKDKPSWVYFSNNHSRQFYGRCMLSTDGGVTFTDISNGLAGATRVRDMSISADGEVAFSTSYHVYFKELNQWFPIKGDNFISGAVNAKNVVFLEELDLVRFFTASAGVVDFRIDDINIAQPCINTISELPYSESFESSMGDWQQSTKDDTEWILRSGGTPSSNTGPSSAGDGNNYCYIESSSPNYPQKQAIFNSPCFDLTAAENPVITFNYHMYGAAMGKLDLEISTDQSRTWQSIWNMSGDQTNAWHEAEVDLSAYEGMIVSMRFIGETGTSYTSDIAIDNINIFEGIPCNTIIKSYPYAQSFENSDMHWEQDTVEDIDWTVISGNTPSSNTGPTAASDGNKYYYVEASFGNNPNKMARFISPCFDLTQLTAPVFKFDYHMYGTDMGKLTVDVSTDGWQTWDRLFRKVGNQNDEWHTAEIDLGPYAGEIISIRFRGVTGAGYTSDIAIDNLLLMDANNCNTLISNYPYLESFENTNTAWTQGIDDHMDWEFNSGTTPSNYTGPAAASEGSQYLFIESSYENNPNKAAAITSPCFNLMSATTPTLSFDYHMYGTSMGKLDVEVSTNQGNSWQLVWSKSGNQSNSWHTAEVDISSYAGQVVNIRFRGETGTSYTSDMAIDNVRIEDGVEMIQSNMLLTSKTEEQIEQEVSMR